MDTSGYAVYSHMSIFRAGYGPGAIVTAARLEILPLSLGEHRYLRINNLLDIVFIVLH